jgi:predicted aminopeptidase
MEIRLTRKPGQPGTRKLVQRFGDRFVCVRYRYDTQNNRRHKTVELIVETVPWRPSVRRARRRDEEMVAVRIAYAETELRERAKRLGAIWRPRHRVWEMRWLDAKRLGINDGVRPESAVVL